MQDLDDVSLTSRLGVLVESFGHVAVLSVPALQAAMPHCEPQ